MANLDPTIEDMLEGMKKFESRNKFRQTSQYNREVKATGETKAAEETKAAGETKAVEETKAAEETKTTISDAILTIKAYHVTIMTGLQSRHEETMEALETHYTQLIDTLEYDLLFISYPNNANNTGCRQLQLASLPGPEGQTPGQSERTATKKTKSSDEVASTERNDTSTSKDPKKERVGPSSAGKILW